MLSNAYFLLEKSGRHERFSPGKICVRQGFLLFKVRFVFFSTTVAILAQVGEGSDAEAPVLPSCAMFFLVLLHISCGIIFQGPLSCSRSSMFNARACTSLPDAWRRSTATTRFFYDEPVLIRWDRRTPEAILR